MAFITSAQVKSYLKITVSDYDADITTNIPIAESDLIRICQNNFNRRLDVSFDSAATAGTLEETYPIENYTLITGTGIDTDTYISDYNREDYSLTLNKATTAEVTEIVYTIPLAVQPLLAQMVWFKVTQMDKSVAIEKKVKGRSIGHVRIDYADAEINSKWDYPSKIIDSLPLYESMQ
jgi:hypothetical protein